MNYDILMIDPPWKKSKGGLRKSRPRQTRDLDYDTMGIEDIFALLDKEIFPKANETNTVFMWCIDKYITVIDDYMFERGYKKHCIFIWNKLNGVAPAFTVRYSHEYLVWYYKPKMIKIAENMRGKLLTVFEERSRQHSRKPNYAYKMIDELYPNSKKIDVFSREKRIGWDVWGNETDKFSTIDCVVCGKKIEVYGE